MFENLTTRLGRVLDSIRGQGRLTEEQINAASRELRMALLEADVALPVVKDFIDKVKTRAVGVEITQSLSPGQEFLRVVQQELTATLGGVTEIGRAHVPVTNAHLVCRLQLEKTRQKLMKLVS